MQWCYGDTQGVRFKIQKKRGDSYMDSTALGFIGVLHGLAQDLLSLPPDRRADLVKMRRRISLSSALREVRTAVVMAIDAIGTDISVLTKVERHYARHVILAGGFFGDGGNYARTAKYGRKIGVQSIWPYPCRNVISWQTASQCLVSSFKRVADETGRAPALICHSKAGQDWTHVADELQSQGLEVVYMIGSPQAGPSRRLFHWIMQRLHGNDVGRDVDDDALQAAIKAGVRVVAFSSPMDPLVLPAEARVRGADNRKRKPLQTQGKTPAAKERRRCENHAGLVSRVADEIFREVLS